MNIANQNKFTRLAAMMLTVLGLTTLSTQTFAKGGGGGGVMLGLNTSYSSGSAELTSGSVTTSVKTTSMLMDVTLGYIMPSGLYLGVLYINEPGTSVSKDAAGVTTTTNSSNTGYGPSVGYMASNGVYIVGHYILSAESDSDTSTSSKYKKGTGLQVDVGYAMPVSSSVNLGFQITYSDIKYASYYNGSTDSTTTTAKATDMYPKIHLGIMF